jgi:hypothetical protein
MTRKITRIEMASDYELWVEYVDPDGVVSQEEFDAMSVAERIAMIEEVFGKEE